MSTKSDLYREVLREYDRLRDISAADLRKRKGEVYAKVPRIEEIEHEISLTGVKIAKAALQNPSQREILISQLKSELADLSETKYMLLQSTGFSPDYLEPKFKCKDCKDTGYIGDKICNCMKQKLVDKAYGNSNLGESLKTENFDYFNFDYYSQNVDPTKGISPRENMKTVLGACIKFANNFDTEFNNIMLYGSSGLGKTFLCNCIAKELLDKGKTVMYVTAPGLFKMIENCRFNKNDFDEPEDYMADILSVDLFIIDDLGTEFSTILSSSELFNIINSRLLAKKPVIISTNLATKDLVDMYSDRIVSRITGGYTVLNLFGDDIRKIKKFKS